MSINESWYTSTSKEWETPQELFDSLNSEFCFDMDVCATSKNTKCDKYWTVEDDALSKEWKGVLYMNPPYGKQIGLFMNKALKSVSENNATIVALTPARTDTKWWNNTIWHADEVRFISGRVKYILGEKQNPAPFPSAIIVFRQHEDSVKFSLIDNCGKKLC